MRTQTYRHKCTLSWSKPRPLASHSHWLQSTDTSHWPGAGLCATTLEHWSTGALEHWSTGAPRCFTCRSLELCVSRESQHFLYCPTFTPPAPARRNWRKSRPAGLLTHWLAYYMAYWFTEGLNGWLIERLKSCSPTEFLLAVGAVDSCGGCPHGWRYNRKAHVVLRHRVSSLNW